MNKLNLLTSTATTTTKKKTVSKLDDHVVKSGIDNQDKFLDPTTNVDYHKIKTLGKGGFAKGKFSQFRSAFVEIINIVNQLKML
jgi:hypothetical protein